MYVVVAGQTQPARNRDDQQQRRHVPAAAPPIARRQTGSRRAARNEQSAAGCASARAVSSAGNSHTTDANAVEMPAIAKHAICLSAGNGTHASIA